MSLFNRCIMMALGLMASAKAETIEKTYRLTDQHGNSILVLTEVKLFRYSDVLKQTMPGFRAVAKNVSDEEINPVYIRAEVRMKSGSTYTFGILARSERSQCGDCRLLADETVVLRESIMDNPTLSKV